MTTRIICCCIKGCSNVFPNSNGISVHPLPPAERRHLLQTLGVAFKKEDHFCSTHFTDSDFDEHGALLKGAVPSINLTDESGTMIKKLTKPCAIKGCSNVFPNSEGISFHSLPWPERKNMSAILNADFKKEVHLCSAHFCDDDFDEQGVLKKGAVPSKNIPEKSEKTPNYKKCCIEGCSSVYPNSEGILFHTLLRIGRKYLSATLNTHFKKKSQLCSAHFRDEDFDEHGALKTGAVPSRNLSGGTPNIIKVCSIKDCQSVYPNSVGISIHPLLTAQRNYLSTLLNTNFQKEDHICSAHFGDEDMDENGALKKTAFPSKNLPSNSGKSLKYKKLFCYVNGCTSVSWKDEYLHWFFPPRDTRMLSAWNRVYNRRLDHNAVFCSLHFNQKDIHWSPTGQAVLHKYAVPLSGSIKPAESIARLSLKLSSEGTTEEVLSQWEMTDYTASGGPPVPSIAEKINPKKAEESKPKHRLDDKSLEEITLRIKRAMKRRKRKAMRGGRPVRQRTDQGWLELILHYQTKCEQARKEAAMLLIENHQLVALLPDSSNTIT